MAEDGAGGTEEAPKKKSKLVLILIVVGVLLVVGGVVAFLLMGGEEPPPEDGQQVEETTEPPKTAKMAPFVVNLTGGNSFIKVVVEIQYDPSLLPEELANTVIEDDVMSDHTLPPELYARRPMMRDAVINVLSGKTAQELLSADGKETLKEELVEVLNEATAFDDAAILNVFFVEFIIQ